MKIFTYALLVLLFSSSVVIAKPASEKSIKEILTITQAQKIIDAVRGQLNYSIDSVIQRSLNGKAPTAKQKKIIEQYKTKINTVLDKSITWKKVEASDIRIYKETFSEKEIQGILAFYKSPAGQAFIKKMPVLSHKRLGEIQMLVSSIEPQLQKISSDFTTKINASNSQTGSPSK